MPSCDACYADGIRDGHKIKSAEKAKKDEKRIKQLEEELRKRGIEVPLPEDEREKDDGEER